MVVLPMVILSFSFAEEVGGTQPRPQAISRYPSEQRCCEFPDKLDRWRHIPKSPRMTGNEAGWNWVHNKEKTSEFEFFFFFHFSRGIERKTQHCSFPVSGETSRDLTTRQRRRQWKCRWKIDFTSSETFSTLYQVSQLPERREVRSELMRGDRVRVQTKIVKFSASPFPFSCQLKIWSFHVVVVQERRGNEQKSAMHVQSCCFANETRWALDVPVAIAVVVS